MVKLLLSLLKKDYQNKLTEKIELKQSQILESGFYVSVLRLWTDCVDNFLKIDGLS